MKPELQEILEHNGVKGMHWGIRKSRDQSESQKGMEHVKLENYKGKTYFISEHNMDGKTLIPRIPQNHFTKNGYEDSTTKRISFAPSVDNALMGLSQNVTGKKFYVHEPLGKHDIYKPNNKAVPDSDVTGELWIKNPVKLKTVGEILATGDAGKPGKPFSYGEHSAELYKFNYEWTNKHSDKEVILMKPELQEILEHSGVKGMHWGKHAAGKVGNAVQTKASKVTSNIKTHVDSITRENSWKKQLKNANDMSTNDLKKVASRAQIENDLKRLSKKPDIGSAKDKKDYLKRAGMTDQEIARKVQRLRAKDSLNRNANEATKKQKEFAKKVMQIAAPLVISYALSGKLSKGDILNTVMNPGGAKAKLVKTIMEKATKAKA
jgi:hypothetical protein